MSNLSYNEALEKSNNAIGINWREPNTSPVIAGWYKCRIKKDENSFFDEVFLARAKGCWWFNYNETDLVSLNDRILLEWCGPGFSIKENKPVI